MYWFLGLSILFVVLAICWNVFPGWRKHMRGMSTVVEATIGSILVFWGEASGIIQQLHQKGYTPDWLDEYMPLIVGGYLVLKRFQTTSPMGSKPDA